eukprot:m.56257 g.56257  ORF g.56257 m.56257 type:complete len:352 (-) comp11183_c0_seq1:1879-2934(-)
MKLLRLNGKGDVEVCEEAWPIIGRGEVLIKVRASSLDHHDVEGIVQLLDGETSPTIGVGFSGIVQQVGELCVRSDIVDGCEVVGFLGLLDACGSLAGNVVVPETNLVLKPKDVSFIAAAAVVPGAIYTYYSMQRHLNIRAGDTVLIMDGASGIGHVAIQLASRWGARVATTAATMTDLLYLQSSAAKHCEIVDLSDTVTSLPYFVEEFTGGLGFDYIMDTIAYKGTARGGGNDNSDGIAHLLAVINALSCGGSWVSSSDSLLLSRKHQRTMFAKSASVNYTNIVSIVSSGKHTNTILHAVADALKLMEEGALNVSIGSEITLEKAAHILNKDTPNTCTGSTVVVYDTNEGQ